MTETSGAVTGIEAAGFERIERVYASTSSAGCGIFEESKVVLYQRNGAVTVEPQSRTLTTQQSADLLGVSRPTIVRLINDGEIAAERIGNRHRLLLDDVLAYREARRIRQYDALAATSTPIAAEANPEVVREQLREARKAVAAHRRARQS